MKRARIHRAYSFDHHFALASFRLCHSLNENGAPAADEDGTYCFAVVRQFSFALQCDIRTRTKLQRSLDSAGHIFYVSPGPSRGFVQSSLSRSPLTTSDGWIDRFRFPP
jgi:hypothetical protein